VPRRTQSERSAATRAALVEATVDSLVEHGWAATTAVEVCRRAGVTRGALAHHFPTLSSLIAAALRTVYEQALAEAGGPPGSLAELLDATWARLAASPFTPVLEAWLASANDPDLAADVVDVVVDFAKLVGPDQLPAGLLDDPGSRTFYLLAREAMLGLALGRATNGGRALGHEAAVLALLRDQAEAIGARS
jgi:AcrR family transcriptional regulator